MLRHTAFALSLAALVLATGTPAAAITLLHKFAGGGDDGLFPNAGLAQSGSTLFGSTLLGGDDNLGTLFSVEADGSNFTLLHEFAGGTDDGEKPMMRPVVGGSTLFGTTERGGENDLGIIYSVQTDGTGYTLLHEFAGGANDGSRPLAGLTLSGSTLFGTTRGGGGNSGGTIFSIETDGTDLTLLYEFAGGPNDGGGPAGDLTLSGSTLYGTTKFGGADSLGTVFSIGTDGTGFTLLHEFAGGPDDGSRPEQAQVALSGSTVFGTTRLGGEHDEGTIFSVGTDGSGFTLLHSFGEGPNDGEKPERGLVLGGSTLFGTTSGGGDVEGLGTGTVFSIESDGSGYTILHEFAAGHDDGYVPETELILSGSTLLGTTYFGGEFGGGTVFALEVPSLIPEPPTPPPLYRFLIYDPVDGRLIIDTDGTDIDTYIFDSISGIFTGAPPNFVGGTIFTSDTEFRIAENFFSPVLNGQHDLGPVALPGLSKDFLLGDLTLYGGQSGNPNFNFILRVNPEPSTIVLVGIGLIIATASHWRQKRQHNASIERSRSLV